MFSKDVLVRANDFSDIDIVAVADATGYSIVDATIGHGLYTVGKNQEGKTVAMILEPIRTERDNESLYKDLSILKGIIPPVTLVRVEDHVIPVVNWIEGNVITSDEDFISARQMMNNVSAKYIHTLSLRSGQPVEFDIGPTNFKIDDSGRVFYIDRDIIYKLILYSIGVKDQIV